MPVAAKCNITSSALQILEKVRGYGCGLASYNIIYENYVEWLACDTIEKIICNPDNCVNETIVHPCHITGEIVYNFEDDGITVDFSLEGLDLYEPPLSYEWTFENGDFELVGGAINDNAIKLRVKEPKELDILVSLVTVLITDLTGCTLYIACYMSPSGCTLVACPNPSDLTLNNKITGCPGNRSLIVFNKT